MAGQEPSWGIPRSRLSESRAARTSRGLPARASRSCRRSTSPAGRSGWRVGLSAWGGRSSIKPGDSLILHSLILIILLHMMRLLFIILAFLSVDAFADDSKPCPPPPPPPSLYHSERNTQGLQNSSPCVSGALGYDSPQVCINRQYVQEKGYAITPANRIVLPPPPSHKGVSIVRYCEAHCYRTFGVCTKTPDDNRCHWLPNRSLDACTKDCASVSPELLKAMMRTEINLDLCGL
jgi:hypothetical protein